MNTLTKAVGFIPIVAIAFVAYANAAQAELAPPIPIIDTVLRYAGLSQSWSVFAPEPTTDEMLLTMPATLADGESIDLDSGFPEGGKGPSPFWGSQSNQRWERVIGKILTADADTRSRFAGYVCHEWNAQHDSAHQLVQLTFTVVDEKILPPGTPSEAARESRTFVAWSGTCPSE